jgi:hypothetical protein
MEIWKLKCSGGEGEASMFLPVRHGLVREIHGVVQAYFQLESRQKITGEWYVSRRLVPRGEVE